MSADCVNADALSTTLRLLPLLPLWPLTVDFDKARETSVDPEPADCGLSSMPGKGALLLVAPPVSPACAIGKKGSVGTGGPGRPGAPDPLLTGGPGRPGTPDPLLDGLPSEVATEKAREFMESAVPGRNAESAEPGRDCMESAEPGRSMSGSGVPGRMSGSGVPGRKLRGSAGVPGRARRTADSGGGLSSCGAFARAS